MAMAFRSSPRRPCAKTRQARERWAGLLDPANRTFAPGVGDACMATLELHDEAGRVRFIELTRDHPALFGTSSACDIVLSGGGISPVHGRIRWKRGRYKVEASPEAQYVLVNGRKMISSSLHQGDE